MKNIENEEPIVHWSFLNVKGSIVLDLGCGKFYSSISTAEYFTNSNASLVVGVDLSDINLEKDNFVMIVKEISSTEHLQKLIDKYLPDVIKCDIEGAEKYLDGISNLPVVKQIAIEYHDATTKEICERKIKEWGFPNIELYTLLNESINRIGVIHAWK